MKNNIAIGNENEEVFVGREEKLNTFRITLEDIKGGMGHTIFIAGEPGVGKTRLACEFKRIAAKEDFIILESVCGYGNTQPYLPIQQALMSSGKDMIRSMSFMDGEENGTMDDKEMLEAHRNAAFYETAEQFRKLAGEERYLIFIDNMHWADKGTLNLFHYLADRLRDCTILFIGTYQPGDAVPGTALIGIKQQMSRKNLYTEIELEPFDIHETEEMLIELTGIEDIPKNFISKLYRKTKGNPLFIKECVHHMIETGIISTEHCKFPYERDDFAIPELIQDVIERRILRLEDSAREVLQLGSVVGEVVPFSLLSNASNLDEFDLLDQIDLLMANKLWIEDPEEEIFQFTHNMVHDIVYNGIGKWLEKKRLHLAVAEAIKNVYDESFDKRYSTLADHYMKAEKYKRALEFYLEAGHKAEEVYSHEDAIDIYNRAIKATLMLPEEKALKLRVLEDLAEVYRLIGDYEKSLEKLYSALTAVSFFEDEQRIYRQIANTWQEHGEYGKALKLIEKRLSLDEEATLERCRLLGKKGWSLMQMGKYDRAIDAFEEEKEVAEEIQDEKGIAQAYHDMGCISIRRGEFEAAVENLERSRKIRQKTDDLKGLSKTIHNLSVIHTLSGNLNKALKEHEECLEIYEEMGDKTTVGKIHNNIGATYQEKGDLDKALHHLHIGYEISEQVGNRFLMCNTMVNIGQTYMDKGELEKASHHLTQGLKISEGADYLDGKIHSQYFLVNLELARGNYDKAEEHLERLVGSTLERDVERDKGLVEHLSGLIKRERGEIEASICSLEEAVRIFDGTGSSDLKAITMYEFGLSLKKNGEIRRSNEHLRDALSYFKKRGMKLWMERCDKAIVTDC